MRIDKLILLALLGGAVAFTSCKKDESKDKNPTQQKDKQEDEQGDLAADGKVSLAALAGNYEGTDEETNFETGAKSAPKPFSFSIAKVGEKSIKQSFKHNGSNVDFTYTVKARDEKKVELESTQALDGRTLVYKMTFTLEGKSIEIHESTTATDPKTKKEKTVETSLVKAKKK